MRALIGAGILAAGLALTGTAGVAAVPAGIDLRAAAIAGSAVEQVQYGYCERLRRACIYKEERGESGEGNCRRYRRECLGGGRSYCDRLRDACIYKEERGESGEGNCRRYRRECD
jgi:hypothetical protein